MLSCISTFNYFVSSFIIVNDFFRALFHSFTLFHFPSLFRLYYHESLRVFHDRLINEQDKAYFYALMKQVSQNNTLG
jgi:hypothetical protein